jgi:Flp pilus assembly protein TadD
MMQYLHDNVPREHPVTVVSRTEPGVTPVSGWLVVSGAVIAVVLGLWMLFDTSGVMSPRGSNAAPASDPVLIVAEADAFVPAAALGEERPTVAAATSATTSAAPPATDDDATAESADPDEITRNPAMLEAFAEGERLAAIGRHREAARVLRLAVALDPTYAPAHYRLGLAYLMGGRRADARAQLEKLEPLDPSLASLLENLLR